MAPAYQSLDTKYLVRPQVDLRLVKHDEFMVGDRMFQLAQQSLRRHLGRCGTRARRQADRLLQTRLCHVHGFVSRRHQRRGRFAVQRTKRDADGDTQR